MENRLEKSGVNCIVLLSKANLRETVFGSSYWQIRESECSKNRIAL